MPSGYTCKIVEGEQSFPEFVWDLVRAMGAFIHMRDDANDAPLRYPKDDFVKKGSDEKVDERRAEVRQYETELRDEQDKTPEQVEAEFEAYKVKAQAEYEATYAKRKPVNERVARLRSEVTDWMAPTPDHEGFKKFMLQQLDDTTRWDAELPTKPVFEDTAAEWHAERVEWVERRIERCKELLQQEIDSPDVQGDRVDWIGELIASVPPPPGRFVARGGS